MLSRVAENIYWMSRYVERAENTARLVNVNNFLLLDLPRGIAPGWEPLVAITGSDALFRERFEQCTERAVLRFLIGDKANPSSIISSLAAARENARTIREILPRMAWEQLTELYNFAREQMASGLTKKGRHAYLTGIIAGSQRLAGMLDSTLMRDEAHYMLRIGRSLERADMTTRILDVRSADLLAEAGRELDPFESIQWMSVLKSLTGYHAYRRKLQTQIQRDAVLCFLLLDQQFPRAVQHCLTALEEALGELPYHRAVVQAVREVSRQLQQEPVGELAQDSLHAFVDELQQGFQQVHDAVAAAYFLPVNPPEPFAPLPVDPAPGSSQTQAQSPTQSPP